MKVAINALHLIPGRLGGLETYLRRLLHDLARLETSTHEFQVYCAREFAHSLDEYAARLAIIPLDVNVRSTPKRIYYEQRVLPKRLRDDGVDVLHSSGYTGPVTKVCKTVLTVHDINYLQIPRLIQRSHGIPRWLVLRFLGPYAMRHTDHLVTDTHHVGQQIAQCVRVPPSRISTIYPCCEDFAEEQAEPFELPVPPGYLLYVASWHPHKNHDLLFHAVVLARQQGIELPPLVLAGLHLRSEADQQRLRQHLRDFQVHDQVHVIDQHLSRRQLAHLFQQAYALVFPSRFEGFGLPVLEAMSARVPVLCSTIQPLPEITGGQALLFDPDAPAELLRQFQRLRNEPGCREALIAGGRKRFEAIQRDNQSQAQQLCRLYESL